MTEEVTKDIIKLESSVTDFKDIKFESKNPLAEQLDINFETFTALLVFQGDVVEIRMPDNRIIKEYQKLENKTKFSRKNLENDKKLRDHLENLNNRLVDDMMPDLKLSERRHDPLEYMQTTAICWEFYHFLKPRLEERMKDYTSFIKA